MIYLGWLHIGGYVVCAVALSAIGITILRLIRS